MRWDRLVTSIEREAALRHAALLWRGFDGIAADAQRSGLPALWRAIDVGRVPCFVSDAEAARNPSWFARRGAAVMRVPLASHEQRTAFWAHALDGAALNERVDLAGIATRFKLTYGRIDEAASTARRLALGRGAGAAEGAAITMRDLQDACRLHSNQRLTSLARKTAAHHQWSDIVLPADRLSQLREICNHVKYRDRVYGEWGFGRKLALGKGLAVLFAGPSGTGKTMAAGIIASELGLDLYKIDLSTVISKYIGETEKNLSRIFDEAETSNAILFFDEADALFGKRSEVRDSHDRYANIEVGYLLQRMEEYEGIAILATNFRKNMDDAFVRRLHFTVEFPFPDERDRHRIWQGIWPADMPREDALDLELLAARYEMTGGNIKNVALAAAFLAADDEDPVVRMSHVVRAVLREYQKTGKLMGDYGERVAGDDPVRR
ncbi:MAG: ATPase, family [Rhizobacter sp.]|nr:ATPase, family [Rhizobacter sp.]